MSCSTTFFLSSVAARVGISSTSPTHRATSWGFTKHVSKRDGIQHLSPGTPASFTTKTGRHDRAEILLKVAQNTKIQKSNQNARWNLEGLDLLHLLEINDSCHSKDHLYQYIGHSIDKRKVYRVLYDMRTFMMNLVCKTRISRWLFLKHLSHENVHDEPCM
jgi:hypothetical protein